MGENRWTDAFILIAMALLALWVNSQFGQLAGRTNEAFVANAYFGMAILSLIVLVASKANIAFFKFIGTEKPLKALYIIIAVGAVVGFVMTSQGKLILARVLTSPGSIDPTLGFTFVILLAPFVEEYLFRGVLFPSFEKFFNDKGRGTVVSLIFAAAISSALFAVWHLVASGGNESILFGEFVFSLIQVSLVRVTGSIAPALSSHLMRNILTFGG